MRALTLFLLVLAAFAALESKGQLLEDDLIFLYNFNQDTYDISVNGLHPTVVGAIPAEDRYGNPNSAFYFDGMDDYLEIPSSSLVQTDFPVSFSCWVKTESLEQLQTKMIHTEFTNMDYNGYWVGTSEAQIGQVVVAFGGGNGITNWTNRRGKVSDSLITANNWHHIVCVIRDALDMDIYIDCEDAGGSYNGGGPVTVAHEAVVGRLGSSPANPDTPITFLRGTLDQVAMWNRALSYGDVIKICQDDLETMTSVRPDPEQGRSSINLQILSGRIDISIDSETSEKVALKVYGLDGRLFFETSGGSQDRFSISRSGLQTGAYVLEVRFDSHVERLKFVVP